MLISQHKPLSFFFKTFTDITSFQFVLKFYIPFNTLDFFSISTFRNQAVSLPLYQHEIDEFPSRHM